MDKLKLVKLMVVLLTFMLVLGTMLLLTAIYKKTRANAAPRHEINFNLSQPTGTSLQGFKTRGNDIYFWLTGGGQSDRVVIYNQTEAAVTSTININ